MVLHSESKYTVSAFGPSGRQRVATASGTCLTAPCGARQHHHRGSAGDLLLARDRGRVVQDNSRSVEASPRGDFTRAAGQRQRQVLTGQVTRQKYRETATTSSTRESSAGSSAAPSASAASSTAPAHQPEPAPRLRQPPRDEVVRLQLRTPWPNLDIMDKDVEAMETWHNDVGGLLANSFPEFACPYPWLEPCAHGPLKPQVVVQDLNLERPFTFSDFKRDCWDFQDDGSFGLWLVAMARKSKENINLVNNSIPQLMSGTVESRADSARVSTGNATPQGRSVLREPLGPSAAVRLGASPPPAGGRSVQLGSNFPLSDRLKQRSLDRCHSSNSLTAGFERGRSREKEAGSITSQPSGRPPASPKPPTRMQRSAR
mmetsp:Transcript_51632/g.95585  ORF Transcript_51632/g.95585 Transcript_51632/m.95585 type:complete len:373 (-) Transcript_51632:153-1271(-)